MWWTMVTISTFVGVVAVVDAAFVDDDDQLLLTCEDARVKCLFRDGCGLALRNYMVHCSSVLQDKNPTHCPEICLNSLIALTSTYEGQALMNCTCSDDFCLDAKQKVEICRPNVTLANQHGTIVTCSVAQFICAADNECSTALYYYKRHCKSMFHGKKCTHRCSNALSILQRQEKAKKLENCKCDGREEYDCTTIQRNMAMLCFKDNRRKHHQHQHPMHSTTSTSTYRPPLHVPTRHRQPPRPHTPRKPVLTAIDVIDEEVETNSIDEVRFETKSPCDGVRISGGGIGVIKSSAVCLSIATLIGMIT